jgi:hypothetical protein
MSPSSEADKIEQWSDCGPIPQSTNANQMWNLLPPLYNRMTDARGKTEISKAAECLKRDDRISVAGGFHDLANVSAISLGGKVLRRLVFYPGVESGEDRNYNDRSGCDEAVTIQHLFLICENWRRFATGILKPFYKRVTTNLTSLANSGRKTTTSAS